MFKRKIKPPVNLVEIKNELLKEDSSIYIRESVKFNDNDYQQINAEYNRVRNFTFVRPQSPMPNNLK